MEDGYELANGSGAIKITGQNHHGQRGSIDRDEADLVRLGKKPVLKRRFGFMSLLGFSCTILITWEGILIVFDIGFANGGPAGLVYSFLLVWIGTTSVYACLSELASMCLQLPTVFEIGTKATQGSYRWRTVLLGLDAGSTLIEEIFQLCHRMAHGVGLASNSGICVLPCRSSDPGVDHFDNACLHASSMAYGSTVLGVDGLHYSHEHHRRKVSAQVRRIHSYTPHSGLLCHSPSVDDLGVASRRFRGLQNLP